MAKKLLIEELERKNLIHIAKEFCLNGYDLEEAYSKNINKVVYKTKINLKKRCEIISEYTEFINFVDEFKGDIQSLYKDTTIQVISKLKKIIMDEHYTKYDVIKNTKTLEHKEIKYKSSYNINDKLKSMEMLLRLSNIIDLTEDKENDTSNTIFNFYSNDLDKDK